MKADDEIEIPPETREWFKDKWNKFKVFKEHNYGFCLLFFLNVVLALCDLMTTLTQSHLLQYLEMNPIYRLTGSLIPVYIANLLFFYALYKQYSRRDVFGRYFIICVMILVAIVRIFALYSVSQIIMLEEPLTVEQAQTMATPEAVQQTQLAIGIMFYIPLIVLFLVYFFYRLDHNIKKK